ncbi:MAG: cytochrome c3 family protein, partial [bacterium]|nr:cytochrome c3 family protein [bacterium]
MNNPRHFVIALLLMAAAGLPRAQQSVLNTPHNLSVTGPGPVKAAGEDRVCIFCHTPHGARTDAPLWNRRDSTAVYLPYNSPSLKAQPGQPTGASKLCLSCHDGTVALGDLVSEKAIVPTAPSATIPAGPGLIGTDLRDDHPISFNYFESLSLAGDRLTAPATWDTRVKLDPASEVQCTTCHEPHDNQWSNFLVMSNQDAALCQQCHRYPYFGQTAHSLSPRQWNGVGVDPWPFTDYPDVRTNACLNCHRSHHAGGQADLVSSDLEEDVCHVCHNGNVSSSNLEAVFQKFSHHPVERYRGAHEDGESPLN